MPPADRPPRAKLPSGGVIEIPPDRVGRRTIPGYPVANRLPREDNQTTFPPPVSLPPGAPQQGATPAPPASPPVKPTTVVAGSVPPGVIRIKGPSGMGLHGPAWVVVAGILVAGIVWVAHGYFTSVRPAEVAALVATVAELKTKVERLEKLDTATRAEIQKQATYTKNSIEALRRTLRPLGAKLEYADNYVPPEYETKLLPAPLHVGRAPHVQPAIALPAPPEVKTEPD